MGKRICSALLILAGCSAGIFAERGYPVIKDGTIKADNGQLLRGCHSHIMDFAKEKYSTLI
jgi:hypothetical protein